MFWKESVLGGLGLLIQVLTVAGDEALPFPMRVKASICNRMTQLRVIQPSDSLHSSIVHILTITER